jgi:hypothetical protein
MSGSNFLPGKGRNGKIPGSEVGSTPTPTPAINSGTKLGTMFPNVVVSPNGK